MGKYDGSKVGNTGRLLQAGGKTGVIETLNCLIYDVPAENLLIVGPLRKKKPEELTDAEKKVLERQRTILRLRQDLARDASCIGAMINYSVCLFPPKNLEKAMKLKADYEKKYEEINEHSDIYILQFHQESTLILKERAVKTLTKRLNKMLDTMDKLQEKINKKEKKDITDGEKRKMDSALKTVDELTKKFLIEDEMRDILKIAEERVKAA